MRLAAAARGLAATLAVGGVACVAVAVGSAGGRDQPVVPLTGSSPAQYAAGGPSPTPPAIAAGRVRPARVAATRTGPAPDSPALSLARSAPVSLVIPALGIRSNLLHLGQAADGSLRVPTGADYDKPGWYRYSPTPGSVGPAVIAGHVDSARGGPSVFFRLGSLRRGDAVRVARADGTTALFEVDSVQRFHKTAFPTRLVYGDTDHAVLRLITCGGEFDRATGHYLDNIVVSASLVTAPA